MNRTISFLAAVAAVLYLFLSRTLAFPANAILKTSMCVLLAILAWRHRKRMLAIALLFSASGDALLAIDGTRLFIPALASFLMTHLLYAVIFVREGRASERWRTIGRLLPVVFAIGYVPILWPHLGSMAIPVLLYIVAIVAMGFSSFRVSPIVVPLGALLFMASDSLIAYEKFVEPANWQGPVIWITYALAQLLITYGLVNSRREVKET